MRVAVPAFPVYTLVQVQAPVRVQVLKTRRTVEARDPQVLHTVDRKDPFDLAMGPEVPLVLVLRMVDSWTLGQEGICWARPVVLNIR